MESGYRIRGGMELLWHLCCSFLPASGIHTKLWGFYTSQTKTRIGGTAMRPLLETLGPPRTGVSPLLHVRHKAVVTAGTKLH